MFLGRQNELKRLNGLYNSGKFEFAVIYGRRRAGKTALINEFSKNKKVVSFTVLETSSRDNLANMSRSISALRYGHGTEAPALQGYQEALDIVYEMSRGERIVLVIDDYHRFAAQHKEFASILQERIDSHFKNSKLMLILCGSSEPFMEKEVLSYDSLYYGRRTAQIKLEPFSFFDVRRYYGDFSLFDIAVIYGATGGIPQYLEMMDPELPIEENIRRNFFVPTSFLFEEPSNLLRQEVREPAYYNAILTAIAGGCTKNSVISSAAGLETSACAAYLKNLIALGIVSKQTPVTEKTGKKTVYEIEDNMFRFWYRFIPENISFIKSGSADRIWRRVAQEIPSYMDGVFKSVCRQWLIQQNIAGRLPINFVDIGRWWGMDPVRRTETELPILAYADDDNAIFADCVWSDKKVDAGVLTALVEKSEMFRYRHRYLYLFSRSGFSEACADEARSIGAYLVMFE